MGERERRGKRAVVQVGRKVGGLRAIEDSNFLRGRQSVGCSLASSVWRQYSVDVAPLVG